MLKHIQLPICKYETRTINSVFKPTFRTQETGTCYKQNLMPFKCHSIHITKFFFHYFTSWQMWIEPERIPANKQVYGICYRDSGEKVHTDLHVSFPAFPFTILRASLQYLSWDASQIIIIIPLGKCPLLA